MSDAGLVVTGTLQRFPHTFNLFNALVVKRTAIECDSAFLQHGDGKPGIRHQLVDIDILSHERNTANISSSSAPSISGT
ncbi:hypothetical protein D3C72_2441370 [compost metagenome]